MTSANNTFHPNMEKRVREHETNQFSNKEAQTAVSSFYTNFPFHILAYLRANFTPAAHTSGETTQHSCVWDTTRANCDSATKCVFLLYFSKVASFVEHFYPPLQTITCTPSSRCHHHRLDSTEVRALTLKTFFDAYRASDTKNGGHNPNVGNIFNEFWWFLWPD